MKILCFEKSLYSLAWVPAIKKSRSLSVKSGSDNFARTKSVRVNFPIESSADRLIDGRTSLDELRRAARGCKACDLWKNATQTVFGEGRSKATIMFVGEQPGDQEDLAGHPFVGPAGRILDEALREAGIERDEIYLTNVVKHFKWSLGERGKRRIHKKPRYSEINACRPWLDAELNAVRPKVLVCLGATAAQALLGRKFRVSRQRGELVESPLAPCVVATVHPSSILRAPNSEARRELMRQFVHDMTKIAGLVAKQKRAA
ncbi:MAG: UdgX family uracil-DNA binding protein [Candidatus Sulfotelmatobacter sp.]